MFRSLLAGLMLAGLAGVVVAAPAPPAAGPGDGKAPVLVLKGKDFLIHAVPVTGTSPTLLVLHTSTATGEMKRLTMGGTWLQPLQPLDDRRLMVSRLEEHHAYIAGIASDAHRFYVLRWHTRRPAIDFLSSQAVPAPLAPPRSSYQLLVFRPSDGKLLHTLNVKESPGIAPAQTTGKGPLQLVPGGVRCLGVTFRFAGEKFLTAKHDK
jgi:hypothetical protein